MASKVNDKSNNGTASSGGHDFDRREKNLEEVRKRLRTGWRHDPDILEQYFKSCYNNWKLYTGARTPKQVLKLQAIYKQGVYGDNTEAAPDDLDSVEGEKWNAWMKLRGTPKEMAKRRFITLLAEIDPLLIDVMPDEKPPIGFPLDRRGNTICAKCNTVVGCIRPILDQHKMPLKDILFDNEEFHEPDKLKAWIRTALANQRCVWGIHMPITRAEARPFMEWFNRDENRGFYPYDSAPIMAMVKDVVTNYHQLAQEMMAQDKSKLDTDAYNAVAIKCFKLKDVYESFSGEDYKFEILCTRDNESCNQRRIADGGKNHKHEFIIDPPTKMDANIMEEAILLRKQCQKLGINPSTGVVKSLQERCDIYRERIAEHFASLKRATEAKARNDNRATVHKTEKDTVIALSKEMLQRQMWDACQENLIDNIMVLAKRGSDVNAESPRGVTPLLCMVINEAVVEKIETLINTYSADINQPNKYGMTPLMMACRMKDMKMVHVLMRNGASALQKVLLYVFIIICLFLFLYMIVCFYFLVKKQGINGQTALHICAIHGSEEIARTLVDYLKDGVGDSMRVTRFVDAMDDNGDTALIVAARRRNGIMCYTLCSLGCNPGIRNSIGRTAAYVARSKTWHEICEWLDKKVGSGANRIETFSDLEFEKKSRFGLIKTRELLQNFARTYLTLIQDRLGLHPLGTPYKAKSMRDERGDRAKKEQRQFMDNHFRYILGRFPEQFPSLMTSLPASYHNEHHQDHLLTETELEERLTSLRNNLADIVKLIRQGYTNPNTDISAQPIAWTPMMCAVVLNDSRTIKTLFREGADPNYPNKDGTTPVMLAAQLQHNQALVDLLRVGGDLQATDNMGFTALAYATSLPLPTIMDRSYVDLMTNDDVGGPKLLSSEEFIKAALLELPTIDPLKDKEKDPDKPTGKIGGNAALENATEHLRNLLMKNEEEASPQNVETQSKFLQLLHVYGLTPLREEANVDYQLKSSHWRMIHKPEDEDNQNENGETAKATSSDDDDDLIEDTFGEDARRKYEEQEEIRRKEKEEHLKKMDPSVLRCPICTLTPPCPHFFKIDSLLSFIKNNQSVHIVGNNASGASIRMSRKVKMKNRAQEVLEETEINDRATDRSATLAQKYQAREEALEKNRAMRFAEEKRRDEEAALAASDFAAFEEEEEGNHRNSVEDNDEDAEELFDVPVSQASKKTGNGDKMSSESAEHADASKKQEKEEEKDTAVEVFDNLPGSAGGMPLAKDGEFTPEMALAVIPVSILKQTGTSGHTRRVRFNFEEDREENTNDNADLVNVANEDSDDKDKVNAKTSEKRMPKKRASKASKLRFSDDKVASSTVVDDKEGASSAVVSQSKRSELKLENPATLTDNEPTLQLVVQNEFNEDNEEDDFDAWSDEKEAKAQNEASSELKIAYDIITTGRIDADYVKKQYDKEQIELKKEATRVFPFNRGEPFGFQDGIFAGLGESLPTNESNELPSESPGSATHDIPAATAANRKITLPGYLFQHLTDMSVATLPPVSMSLTQSAWVKILESLNDDFHATWRQELEMSVLIHHTTWMVTAPTCILCQIGYIRHKETLVTYHTKRDVYESERTKMLKKLFDPHPATPASTDVPGHDSSHHTRHNQVTQEDETSLVPFLCFSCMIRRELYHRVLKTQPRSIRRTLHTRWPLLATHDPQFNHMPHQDHVDAVMNIHAIAPLPKHYPPLGMPASPEECYPPTPMRPPMQVSSPTQMTTTAMAYPPGSPPTTLTSPLTANETTSRALTITDAPKTSSSSSEVAFFSKWLGDSNSQHPSLDINDDAHKFDPSVTPDTLRIMDQMDDLLTQENTHSVNASAVIPVPVSTQESLPSNQPLEEPQQASIPNSPIKSTRLRELDALLERHMRAQLTEWSESSHKSDDEDDIPDDISQVSSLSQVSVSYEKNWMLSVLNNLSATESVKGKLLHQTSNDQDSSRASLGTSITVSTVSQVNPFKRPREMTLLPYYIAQGLFEDSERLARILLGKPAIDEGEGHAFLLEILLQLAESYKLMGLYQLSLSMYLDALTRTIALCGWLDRLTYEVCLPSLLLCYRRMGLERDAQSLVKKVLQEVQSSMRKNGKQELMKKLHQVQRSNLARFVKINSLWTKYLQPRLFLPSAEGEDTQAKDDQEKKNTEETESSDIIEDSKLPTSRHHSTSHLNDSSHHHHHHHFAGTFQDQRPRKWHRFERLLGMVGLYVFYTSTLPVFVTHRKIFRDYCHTLHRQYAQEMLAMARWQRQRERVLHKTSTTSSSTSSSFSSSHPHHATHSLETIGETTPSAVSWKKYTVKDIDDKLRHLQEHLNQTIPDLKYVSATTYEHLQVYIDFLDLYFTIYHIDDPVIYRYLLQHLWRHYLAKQHTQTSPLPQLFRRLTTHSHILEIAYFFRFGKELSLSVFDPLVHALLQAVLPVYRRFFLHAEMGVSYRELFLVTLSEVGEKETDVGLMPSQEEAAEDVVSLPAVAEAFDQAATMIQTVARAYGVRKRHVFGPALRKHLAKEETIRRRQQQAEAEAEMKRQAAEAARLAQQAEAEAAAARGKAKRAARLSVVLPESPVLPKRQHY